VILLSPAVILPAPEARDAFLAHLRQRHIHAVFHYLPLHLSDYAVARWNGKPGDCPMTDDVSERLVRLPFYNSMDSTTQERVIETVTGFDF